MPTLTAPTQTNGNVQIKTDFQILSTTNYDLFKLLGNNRELNLLHVKRLVESFNEKYLICPIIVNERYEVIDGQHRLAACRETKKPIFYIKVKGYGIKEVQIFNTNQKNWTRYDFLEMYCSEGRKPYLEFKEFMIAFPDFGIRVCEKLLTGYNQKSKVTGGILGLSRYFERGELSISNIPKSYLLAKKVVDYKPFFSEYHTDSFVNAIVPLFTSKNYNHKEMLHKLGSCPHKLFVCNNIDKYRVQLENIYNYKRQKENKVSFRYE